MNCKCNGNDERPAANERQRWVDAMTAIGYRVDVDYLDDDDPCIEFAPTDHDNVSLVSFVRLQGCGCHYVFAPHIDLFDTATENSPYHDGREWFDDGFDNMVRRLNERNSAGRPSRFIEPTN